MKKYKYETVTLGYALSKKSLTKKLQEILEEKANEGWRLVKFDFSDWLGACVVVFEKEIIE